MIAKAQLLGFRGINFFRDHAYILAVAVLAGVLLSVVLPDLAQAKCKPEGVPERAGSGVPGLLDSRDKTMDGDTLYGDYGYSGLTWYACDLGGPIAGNEWAGDPDAMMDTKIGNAGLALSKWLAAAVTGMHAWNTNTSDVLKPLDDMIVKLSTLVRELVVDQWMILFILLAAVTLFAWSVTKEVRKTMLTLFAFGASVTFLAVVGAQPLTVAHAIDDVGSNTISTADQRALEVTGIDAKPSEAIGGIMNDQVIYPLWAKGALGKDDQTKAGADTWANKLYRAEATTYDQTDVDSDDKKDEYEDIYDDLGKSDDPSLQQYMKGQGYNRAGIGLATLVQTGFISVIRIAAESLIFASKLIFRFIPIIGPVFAVLGVWHMTRSVAKEGLNMVGAAAINVLIFGVLAALHTALIAFLSTNLDFAPMLFISAIATVVFWKFTKPFRSLTQMVTPSSVQSSMHSSSSINPMSALLSAWALLNTGKSGKSESRNPSAQGDGPEGEVVDNEDYVDPKDRHHTENTGPSYSDDAPALPIGTPGPRPQSPNSGGFAVEPTREAQALEPSYTETPRNVPEPVSVPAAGDASEPQDQEVLHTIQQSDTDAAKQRQDDHGERLLGDRIVGAIDRAAASNHDHAQAPGVPQSGELVDSRHDIPEGVVRLERAGTEDYYFDPHVEAQTRTEFNQRIFVPGAQTQTYYQRTDTESETSTHQDQE